MIDYATLPVKLQHNMSSFEIVLQEKETGEMFRHKLFQQPIAWTQYGLIYNIIAYRFYDAGNWGDWIEFPH